jgi:hypothetical protein
VIGRQSKVRYIGVVSVGHGKHFPGADLENARDVISTDCQILAIVRERSRKCATMRDDVESHKLVTVGYVPYGRSARVDERDRLPVMREGERFGRW